MYALLQKMHHRLTLHYLRHLLCSASSQQNEYRPISSRLLYVAASCLPYHISGYTTRTHEILCALQREGVDARVLTRPGYPWDRSDALCHPPSCISMVDTVEYHHERHPANNRFTAIFAAQAAKVIVRSAEFHQVSRIHAASNHVNALPALIAARRLGIPFQYEMRGLWELTRASRQPEFENSHNYNLGLELEGFVASHAERVFVISEQLAKFARDRWGIPSERLHLLPNCVDVGRLLPADAAGVVPNTLGYAGSLIGYEGLDTLIYAVGMLVKRGVPVRLHIIGDGEARPQLEQQVQSSGLRDVVLFSGKVAPEKARALIGECAMVCIPRKPYKVCQVVPPIKLVEAMALGKPVIVPDLPVFQDEVGPDGAGQSCGAHFFRAGDADNLAAVIASLLADPVKLAELGARARQHVLEHRQWRHYTGALAAQR